MSIISKYVIDEPRVSVKVNFLATESPMTLKQLIETKLKEYFKLFVNREVADDGAMFALTNIDSGYLVYKTDTKEFWLFTGVDPSESSDWTLVAFTAADEVARLANAVATEGTVAFQEDTDKFYRLIGADPSDPDNWLLVENEAHYTQYVYTFLKMLSGKIKYLHVESTQIFYYMTAFINDSNGECPYSEEIIEAYGNRIAANGNKQFYGSIDPQRFLVHVDANSDVYLDISFER